LRSDFNSSNAYNTDKEKGEAHPADQGVTAMEFDLEDEFDRVWKTFCEVGSGTVWTSSSIFALPRC